MIDLRGKHLLKLADFRPEEITYLIDLAAELKAAKQDRREEQTLALLAQGLATKQIGRALDVTPKTADHYVQQVYAKIGVNTRAAAAVYAMQHGVATNATREFSR